MYRLARGDRLLAWSLMLPGVALLVTGIGLAIHTFTLPDILPVAVDSVAVVLGFRFLNRRWIF